MKYVVIMVPLLLLNSGPAHAEWESSVVEAVTLRVGF
jgi:hypothetical protein